MPMGHTAQNITFINIIILIKPFCFTQYNIGGWEQVGDGWWGAGADSEPVVEGSLNFGQEICWSRIRAKQQERGSSQEFFSNLDALKGQLL